MEMEASTVPAVQKRLYRNNTGGYLGVVQLSHDGKPEGVGIEPYGTIWLSDQEAVLTARAPRMPKDNPFEEQSFVVQDPATGQRRDIKMRPLVLVDGEERYVPANDRYVPTEVGRLPEESGPAPAAEPEEAPPEAGPPSTGSQGAPEGLPPSPGAPPVAAPAVRSAPPAEPPTAPDDAPERQSWVAEPEAPGQVLQGALGGDDTPPAAPGEDLPPLPPHVPTQAPVMQTTPPPPEEEHAAAVDPAIGEETGAAKPPTTPPAEGEFARAEEVGSPDAPATAGEDPFGEE